MLHVVNIYSTVTLHTGCIYIRKKSNHAIISSGNFPSSVLVIQPYHLFTLSHVWDPWSSVYRVKYYYLLSFTSKLDVQVPLSLLFMDHTRELWKHVFFQFLGGTHKFILYGIFIGLLLSVLITMPFVKTCSQDHLVNIMKCKICLKFYSEFILESDCDWDLFGTYIHTYKFVIDFWFKGGKGVIKLMSTFF